MAYEQVDGHIPFSLCVQQSSRTVLLTPLNSFVSLLHEIANVPAHTTSSRLNRRDSVGRSPRIILGRWIAALKENYSPLPRDTTAHVFRLLFPEEDSHRKYDLQEARLSQLLPECLDPAIFSPVSTARLKRWSQQYSSGCLGEEIIALQSPHAQVSRYTFDIRAEINPPQVFVGPKSLQQVNLLLDELASTSVFSDKSIHAAHSSVQKRSKSAILRSLYNSLPALDAAYLTQIILKDLRPILYAPPIASTSRVLLEYNLNSKSTLTKEQFMMTWDPSGSMLKMYRVRANMTEAALGFEAGGIISHPKPCLNVPVEVRMLEFRCNLPAKPYEDTKISKGSQPATCAGCSQAE